MPLDITIYGLTLDTATSSSLSVSWQLTGPVDWIELEYQVVEFDTSWRQSSVLTGTTTSDTLFGLEPEQQVLIRIHARGLDGTDAYTEQKTFETCIRFYQGASCEECKNTNWGSLSLVLFVHCVHKPFLFKVLKVGIT